MTPLSHTYWHPTNMHGYTLRLPSHRAIQWLHNPDHERQRIAAMRQVIAPTDTVLDIGAEQGDISALIASWVPDGGVVLVEPNPKVWPCIRATFEENGLPTPLRTFQGFCATERRGSRRSRPGWQEDSVGPIDPAAGFLHLAEDWGVSCSTIDVLARHETPDVITIDVEGAELEVLRGASDTLTDHRPTVFVSVHERFMAHHFGQRPADLYALFDRYDYRLFHLGSDHEQHIMAVPK